MSEYRNYINNIVTKALDELYIPDALINNILMPYFDENHAEYLKPSSNALSACDLISFTIFQAEELLDEDDLSEDDFINVARIYNQDLMNATVNQPLTLQYANSSSSSSSSMNIESIRINQEVNTLLTWENTSGHVLDSKAEIGAAKSTKEELRAIHNLRF